MKVTIDKKIEHSKYTLNQADLTDIEHTTQLQNILFFSIVHETFSKIDHILENKTKPNKT